MLVGGDPGWGRNVGGAIPGGQIEKLAEELCTPPFITFNLVRELN